MDSSLCFPERADSGIRGALSALGLQQHGVARRSNLTATGMTARAVDGMLLGGRWRAHGAVVVAMHNGPLTPDQQLWAAVLNAGPNAALAARTAAAQHGLVGWPADCIELLVPRGTTVPKGLELPVKIHESRRFTVADLHPGRTLPQVRAERALIDAAVWSSRPRTACGVLAAGVQQRLTTPAKLFSELDLAGAVRHRRLLAAALGDIAGGAQAVSEIDFLRFCRRNGLPKPLLQEVRVDARGRRRYLDATFRGRDGKLLRVEIDGALHLVVHTYWDDMSRGNEMVIDREQVLRFPSYVIYADDASALDQLRRALDLSGPRDARAC
ncbi:MAG TPA: hypothetical protein VHV76_10670 [Mycobacteriales bacterium]|nr:hypothetical protein [Mycobacteriales bacterium]